MKDSASRQALHTATKLADVASHAGGAQLWTARVDRVQPSQWSELNRLLDAAERAQALRFRFDGDRRAYVLAHALRRAMISLALQVDPQHVQFVSGANGQPLLRAADASRPIYFSHSRCRLAVAIALAPSPVGVDVEVNELCVAETELRRPYVDNTEAHDFFTWWTTLEAFWKAVGTGLASSNPRICSHRNGDGTIDIALETMPDRPMARAAQVRSQPGCTISVALRHSATSQALQFA